ncbi:P-loop containing nucleoside triphosphate hydrolase protein, partial [Mycena epipterygia]
PPTPQIFHGRASELQDIIAILTQDSAHVVILGPGGMGKTSLAAAALHHPDIKAKYGSQYFILCDSSENCADLISNIGSYLHLDHGPNLSGNIVRHFSSGAPSLLLLDNLETPWEPVRSRPEVEHFLSRLSQIPHLGILITMRGVVRPGKVKWSRPFLPPLKPYSDGAALQTFIDITDEDHAESAVKKLLSLTGNLPLVVNLIANVVSYERCDITLSRWETENTSLLSDGSDRRSSLDMSITLSLSSSRMTTEAHKLLTILSILPDGISDADIVQANLPIPNIFTTKATLIRTSLAYIGNDQRLRVLVPIREHVRATHPPAT